MSRSSRRRHRLGSLALLLGSATLTALALEVGFRLLGVGVGTVQINRATVRRSGNQRLRFELRPGASVRAEVEYRINGLGMRNPETTEEKAPDVRRIAVVGDSIAFGYWVPEEQAFPRQLESLLGGRAAGIEVLNLGVPGYNLEQEIEALRVKALGLSPDLVVVALCLNDLEGVFSYELGLTLDRAARRRTLPGRAREALLDRSRLLSWLEYRLAEADARRAFVRARDPLGGPLYAEAVSAQAQALRSHFAILAALLRSRRIPGLVAIFPVFGNRFAAYPYRELHQAVAASARESGLLVADLLDCYRAYDFWDVRVDVVHPSPLGHRVAAHALRDALCAEGLLCEGPPPPGRCTDYRKDEFPAVRGY